MDLFTTMRWNNADWYTANPLLTMTDEQLAGLSEQAGMSVEELRRHMSTPHSEMTCPSRVDGTRCAGKIRLIWSAAKAAAATPGAGSSRKPTAQTPPTGCASACANAWRRRRGAPATGFPTPSSTPMVWAAAWSALNVGET